MFLILDLFTTISYIKNRKEKTMTKYTNITLMPNDEGKNLYRKTTFFTVIVEQDILAYDKDQADSILLDNGGIDYNKINSSITHENGGVETRHVDANFLNSDPIKYLGKVEYSQDEEDFVINDYADEKPTYKPRQLDLPFGEVA